MRAHVPGCGVYIFDVHMEPSPDGELKPAGLTLKDFEGVPFVDADGPPVKCPDE